MYDIDNDKQEIVKENNCYLVEGYTDVIQFHQTGINNVVSSSGTALTHEQIRLVNRLTKNITVLFDGDAAGLKASLRGIDLILEQGMNVKICTFPEGEDPDSFAKNNSFEKLTNFLKENTKDFINFKASILASETKNDPIKKAETIRDMVVSIAKIPDVIKREVYVKECSRIMDISEEVLFNTLAQILQKERRYLSERAKKSNHSIDVISSDKQPVQKVDIQFKLEKKLIELLLLYGVNEENFEEVTIETNENGEIIFKSEIVKAKVFEKIYLDLQEDEIEFTNENLKELYHDLITCFNQEQEFQLDHFINRLEPEKAETVTHLLMDDEKYHLDNWESKDIYVKDKDYSIAQIVTETILNLRRYLVSQKINELSEEINELDTQQKENSLKDIVDYLTLKKILSEKLNRVL